MAADKSITETRVCPRCGAPESDRRFCSGCGLNLLIQPELPSEDEYDARVREERWFGTQARAPASAPLYGAMPVARDVEEAAAAPTFAGWWERVGATLVDMAVLVVPAVIFWYAFSKTLGGLALIATTFAYFLLMTRDGDKNGQTLGKQVVNIRVRRVDGAPVNVRTVAVRQLLMQQLLGLLTLYLFFIPDCLWPLWSKENRAIHDIAAGTRVIKTDAS